MDQEMNTVESTVCYVNSPEERAGKSTSIGQEAEGEKAKHGQKP